jgi:hypothetical protein
VRKNFKANGVKHSDAMGVEEKNAMKRDFGILRARCYNARVWRKFRYEG